MSPVVTQPAPTRRRLSRMTAACAVAAVAALVGMLPVISGLQPPVVRDRVTIENPTEWHAEVHVSEPDGARLHIGTVAGEGKHTFQDVIDPGSGWLFRFSYAGGPPVEQYLSRTELEAARWTVTVPAAFGEQMLARDMPPSA